jgi:hypothetical protein
VLALLGSVEHPCRQSSGCVKKNSKQLVSSYPLKNRPSHVESCRELPLSKRDWVMEKRRYTLANFRRKLLLLLRTIRVMFPAVDYIKQLNVLTTSTEFEFTQQYLVHLVHTLIPLILSLRLRFEVTLLGDDTDSDLDRPPCPNLESDPDKAGNVGVVGVEGPDTVPCRGYVPKKSLFVLRFVKLGVLAAVLLPFQYPMELRLILLLLSGFRDLLLFGGDTGDDGDDGDDGVVIGRSTLSAESLWLSELELALPLNRGVMMAVERNVMSVVYMTVDSRFVCWEAIGLRERMVSRRKTIVSYRWQPGSGSTSLFPTNNNGNSRQ